MKPGVFILFCSLFWIGNSQAQVRLEDPFAVEPSVLEQDPELQKSALAANAAATETLNRVADEPLTLKEGTPFEDLELMISRMNAIIDRVEPQLPKKSAPKKLDSEKEAKRRAARLLQQDLATIRNTVRLVLADYSTPRIRRQAGESMLAAVNAEAYIQRREKPYRDSALASGPGGIEKVPSPGEKTQ